MSLVGSIGGIKPGIPFDVLQSQGLNCSLFRDIFQMAEGSGMKEGIYEIVTSQDGRSATLISEDSSML